ncbi:MAG TPA: hypothetical protein VGI65_21750 [Steroidobacteraceae bacterium]
MTRGRHAAGAGTPLGQPGRRAAQRWANVAESGDKSASVMGALTMK